jgi:hypothetical protein
MVLIISYTSQYYVGYADISEVAVTTSLLNLWSLNDAMTIGFRNATFWGKVPKNVEHNL